MAYLLWQRVRASAEKHPDRLAISDGSRSLRYRELVAEADAVTALLQQRGLEPGARVGVVATKSTRCVSAMLGALQAGACYVPVDPRSPAGRARYILENAHVELMVSEAAIQQGLDIGSGTGSLPSAERTLLLDDRADGGRLSWSDLPAGTARFAPAERNEHDPAYILYTSGSTGKPKGVVISHRNALTFVDWARDTFELGPEDRLSNHAPFHFDLSVLDLYGAFAAGGSVHLVPDRLAPFPRELARWIQETGITVWYSVPSALVRLQMMGELGRYRFEQLRAILFAGEVFPVKHLRTVMDSFPTTGFHNLYGPTETNVCTYYPVPRPLPETLEDLPIGGACANMEAFALTDEGTAAGLDGEGELLVRGPCVMLGYWGLPDRTAESIIQNPLHSDYRDPVYRTGDRVQVLSEGGFRFLGRRDHMVKVRGYRVELGEVEHALHQHPLVREAAVVAVEDEMVGARLKAALVAASGSSLDSGAVLKHCLERLPHHAVPESIVFLDELPRTSTGKTDRVKLKDLLSSAR